MTNWNMLFFGKVIGVEPYRIELNNEQIIEYDQLLFTQTAYDNGYGRGVDDILVLLATNDDRFVIVDQVAFNV